MTVAEFELALHQDGFNEVLTRELPAGFATAEHSHPFDVRALVLAGEITLTVDGLGRAYSEGDVFVMPAGRRHGETVGSAGVHYVAGRRVADRQS
jgi:quercetin dioxygenase-like cupin family protein